MNPVEADEASKNRLAEAHHKLHGPWMLVGAINEEMYLAFKAKAGSDVATQLNLLPTPAGATYGIVTIQIDVRQHRFVLTLFDSKVLKFLASAANLLIVYLECAGDLREGMLYDCLLAPDQLALARTMGLAIGHRQQEEFTNELPSLLSEMLSVSLIPSLNAKRVLAVDVSVFLPRPQN